MTIMLARCAHQSLNQAAPRGGLRVYTPLVMAHVVAIGMLAGASAQAQEQASAYQPPPLFSGQGHGQLTTAGVMPPASAPGATAASPTLDPAIQALVEGQTPQAAAQLSERNPAVTGEREDVPWALRADNRPWNLHFTPSNPIGTLYLSPPTARDARIMMPGLLADTAHRTRFTVNKFITDAISTSSQARARQLEALTRWIENSTSQLARVRDNEWENYQFNVESRREIDSFRAKVAEQSAPDLKFVEAEIVRGVEALSPLLAAMPNYELQMAWYNAMVQMKEGFTLYQGQVQRADHQLLAAIDDYIAAHPYVPRPSGAVPPKNTSGFGASGLAANAIPAPVITPSIAASGPVVRTPAEPVPVQQSQSTSQGMWLAFIGMALAAAGWFFLKTRFRRSKGAITNKKS